MTNAVKSPGNYQSFYIILGKNTAIVFSAPGLVHQLAHSPKDVADALSHELGKLGS